MGTARSLCYTPPMPTVDKHAPGSFCWVELATSDQAAAKQFYASLFGWDVADFPMGPSGVYTMFKLGGRDAAAAYTLNDEMKAQGVPPHWALYIATANADETAAKATAAGGKICAPPFDVYDFGRMAVLTDPTGANFCIWQAKSHFGIGVAGDFGSLCWADLSTPNVDTAEAFYKQVFGWEISAGQDGSGYLHIKNGEQFIGGIPPAQHRNPNAPPHWLLYYAVADCDAATAKATGMGASVYVPPMTMEGVGRWSIVADPQGAVFSLFQPMPRK